MNRRGLSILKRSGGISKVATKFVAQEMVGQVGIGIKMPSIAAGTENGGLVGIHRCQRDRELTGDFLGRESLGKSTQHVMLAFGQFGNDRISPTAAMLDKKLEALVAAAFK